MAKLNFKHLHYFYMVAKEGSIARAAETLFVSPQSISGQLSVFEDQIGGQLFERRGKRLLLNERGRLVFDYADSIFSLGDELQQSLKRQELGQQHSFSVGVIDVIPKILAFNLLKVGLDQTDSIRLVSREGDFDSLLAELATGKLDLIISDRPLAPGLAVKAYNHFLGESGLSFYADKETAAALQPKFPASLQNQPFLISSDKSAQKISLFSWFEQLNIAPNLVAEFDDTALLKFFGQANYGVFCTSRIIEEHVVRQYGVHVIGRTDEVKERYYAISPERKIKHPGVKLLVEHAENFFGSSE